MWSGYWSATLSCEILNLYIHSPFEWAFDPFMCFLCWVSFGFFALGEEEGWGGEGRGDGHLERCLRYLRSLYL